MEGPAASEREKLEGVLTVHVLTDDTYEYQITKRWVLFHNVKCNRFIFVRRKIGKEKWYQVPDSASFANLAEAERSFAVFGINRGIHGELAMNDGFVMQFKAGFCVIVKREAQE